MKARIEGNAREVSPASSCKAALNTSKSLDFILNAMKNKEFYVRDLEDCSGFFVKSGLTGKKIFKD